MIISKNEQNCRIFFTYFSYFFKLINKQKSRDLLSLITFGYASINLQKLFIFRLWKIIWRRR